MYKYQSKTNKIRKTVQGERVTAQFHHIKEVYRSTHSIVCTFRSAHPIPKGDTRPRADSTQET